MKSEMQILPIDSIPVFCPSWESIKHKASLYQTARLRTTGEHVKLCRLVSVVDGLKLAEPVFAVRVAGMAGVEHRTTEELCGFTL